MAEEFAPPTLGLGSPALRPLVVATFPSAGMGLALTPAGRIPDGLGAHRRLLKLEEDVASTASTSFQDITGLKFDVLAGTDYRWFALLGYTCSATTIGLRVAVSAPSTTHLAYFTQTGISATGSLDAAWENAQSTTDAGTASTDSIATDGNILVMYGWIRPSAAGTVQLRFAPETATASGIVIEAGSTLEWW